MNTTNRPLRARSAVPHALAGALQWRLLLVWIIATLLCALLGALPVWNWLAVSAFDRRIKTKADAAMRTISKMINKVLYFLKN